MLDLADRLNETIINMLKKIKGKYSLKDCTGNEFQQKNQMDLLELKSTLIEIKNSQEEVN